MGKGVLISNCPGTLREPQKSTPAAIRCAAVVSLEQARGKALDKRTDVWSFGCTLYETLTGRRAFQGETVTDTLVAVLGRDPDWSAYRIPRQPGRPA